MLSVTQQDFPLLPYPCPSHLRRNRKHHNHHAQTSHVHRIQSESGCRHPNPQHTLPINKQNNDSRHIAATPNRLDNYLHKDHGCGAVTIAYDIYQNAQCYFLEFCYRSSILLTLLIISRISLPTQTVLAKQSGAAN